MTTFKLGKLTIDAVTYGSQGNAVLGIRDSGKTFTATFIAERLFDAGIPFVAFDPIGVWRFLRVPGSGKGYPVVVAGGMEGDLPLTVAGAPEIVRAAMHNGVSLVIDLFDVRLSKADWRKIVTACVRVLLHENSPHGLRHIFLEESSEFIPQKVLDGVVYAEVEKLARMGGNSRLGYTLINQRSQEVSKAVLELCENLFLHRQRGKNALENIEKWLAIAGAAEQKEIIRSLPDLPQGECWAWIGGDKPTPPTLIKVPPKNSFHPDRRVMRGDKGVKAKKAVDVGSFVEGMRATLVKVEEEAKANDPKLLRAEIEQLKRQLHMASLGTQEIPSDTVVKEYRRGVSEGYALGWAAGWPEGFRTGAYGAKELAADRMEKAVGELRAIGRERIVVPAVPAPAGAEPPVRAARGNGAHPPRRRDAGPPAGDGAAIPRGEKACLIAIAQRDHGLRREQLTVMTGYKRSSRDAYIQRLRERGYVEVNGDRVVATEAGVAALGGNYDPLPTGPELRARVLRELPEGERRVLEVLIQHFPGDVDRNLIDNVTGYQRSSRDAYLQRLRARELVVQRGRGAVRASETLFDGGVA